MPIAGKFLRGDGKNFLEKKPGPSRDGTQDEGCALRSWRFEELHPVDRKEKKAGPEGTRPRATVPTERVELAKGEEGAQIGVTDVTDVTNVTTVTSVTHVMGCTGDPLSSSILRFLDS